METSILNIFLRGVFQFKHAECSPKIYGRFRCSPSLDAPAFRYSRRSWARWCCCVSAWPAFGAPMPIWVCRGCPWHMFEIPEMGCPNASQKCCGEEACNIQIGSISSWDLYKHVFPFLSECMHFCKMSMYFCSVRIDLHPQIFTCSK